MFLHEERDKQSLFISYEITGDVYIGKVRQRATISELLKEHVALDRTSWYIKSV